MATPVGHGIVGYALARMAGVKSRPAIAAAIAAANLPDVDFLLGYVRHGDVMSLHQEVITHKKAFPLIVGAAAAAAAAGLALLRGRPPTPGEVLRPAALATAFVGSHLVMDPLPIPYEPVDPVDPLPSAGAAQAWNAVIDMALYGGLAMLVLGNGNGKNDVFA